MTIVSEQDEQSTKKTTSRSSKLTTHGWELDAPDGEVLRF